MFIQKEDFTLVLFHLIHLIYVLIFFLAVLLPVRIGFAFGTIICCKFELGIVVYWIISLLMSIIIFLFAFLVLYWSLITIVYGFTNFIRGLCGLPKIDSTLKQQRFL